jgi:hypothetical protein
MMTATVAALGLVPFLFATGPGSEIQRPLAIVVIGGLVSSTALTLLLLLAVYAFFEGKEKTDAIEINVPLPITTALSRFGPPRLLSHRHLGLARCVSAIERQSPFQGTKAL